MERTIKHNWYLPHPPETVWAYLTVPELLSQWLMDNDIKAEVGHKFQFRTKPVVKFGFDGKVYCEITEVIPMKRLSYSWRGGPGEGKITLDTVVTWTLTPKGDGTELGLEHRGFKGLRNYPAYFFINEGWRSKIKKRLLALAAEQTHK